METLANGHIDGIIMSIAKETLKKQDFHHIKETIDLGIPVVLFDRVISDLKCDKVIVNDKQAAKEATQTLIDDNRKNILLLTSEDYVSVGNLRTEGYLEALKDNDIIPDSDLIIKVKDKKGSELEMSHLEDELEKVLNAKKVDAILGVNEIYAGSALKVLKKNKISVPKEISIISFTDGVISRYSSPSLSTISQHGEIMGERSAKLLIDKLLGKTESNQYKTEIINCSLIKRESS
jgi:LacI family transcriptional regulator